MWGKPEDIYLALKAGYDAARIPIRGWEPDNNFNVTYFEPKNWKGVDLKRWNTTLYPSDGAGFVAKLQTTTAEPLAMVYYTNGFTEETAHKADWPGMVKCDGGLEPHPNESAAFHADVFGHAAREYGMAMLFTDFLCYRGPSMGAYQDVADGEEGAHLWLAGMTRAATEHGAEVQYCMALAHQILASAQFREVTNARVNGDGGLDVAALTLPALLAATVGLGWSKDNLRTADRCYVNATWANGTVKWPCGSINRKCSSSLLARRNSN